MTIKRPDNVKIISKKFSVLYVEEGTHGLPEDDIGQCDGQNQMILVQDGLQLNTEKTVLIHEILHGISDEMGLNLTEEQVDGSSKGIMAVLMDNPSFARFLLKKETKRTTTKKEPKNDETQIQDEVCGEHISPEVLSRPK